MFILVCRSEEKVRFYEVSKNNSRAIELPETGGLCQSIETDGPDFRRIQRMATKYLS